ncbi:helix-hairpin-helix domain-containing protein [Chitinophaga sedimenti]|uniref:helix-hairpin-helix domain-containing protein n=1 Tax=Chitinophaga sedimenti TaxID=2033606 RepID=UPI002003302B|nr:helix-hairpin-helix domain-containing protein [Chitinophaga sedimenti]MCK7556831.1 helix-hairpin-helix domain-containing protein [Chitinophaga sedimenti]
MDNYAIADNFSLLAKLMDIHGDNPFKAKSFANAAFQIEKLTVQLKDTPANDIFRIKGIGESTGKSVLEMLETGRSAVLEDYLAKTPAGIPDMMRIKGLGPKKIATIWKEMEIEDLGALLYACNENRLLLTKGFGQKTQDSIRQSIEFFLSNRERYLYAELETFAQQLETALQEQFAPARVSLSGVFRRNQPVIDELDVVIGVAPELVLEKIKTLQGLTILENTNDAIFVQHEQGIKIKLYGCAPANFAQKLFITTGTESFLEKFYFAAGNSIPTDISSEEEIFSQANMQFIEPCLREGGNEITRAQQQQLPELINVTDIKGIIHSHSQWSDGLESLEAMATAAKAQGFEYR